MSRWKQLLGRLTYRTLKVDILALFLSLLTISFILVISFTYVQNSHAILQLSKRTVERVSSSITEKIKSFAKDIEVSVRVSENFLADLGAINFNDQALLSFMLNAVRFDNNISNFYIANTQGESIAV